MYEQNVIEALARLRTYAAELSGDRGGSKGAEMAQLVNALDNAGVFAALDEQTDYASAEDILAEAARDELDKAAGGPLDPAEWGDTTRADMARHQGLVRLISTDGEDLTDAYSPQEPAEDEWSARARAIESIRPKGRKPSTD